MFDFVSVILCTTGLLGLLAYAALHEDDGKRAVNVSGNAPHLSE